MHMNFELTKEEQFLWNCGHEWRQPSQLAIPDGLDWPKVIAVGRSNRMQTLLWEIVQARELAPELPEQALADLENGAQLLAHNAELMSDALRLYCIKLLNKAWGLLC